MKFRDEYFKTGSFERTNMSEQKIAGAPISWGVIEVPNWGHQMQRERVLNEMTSIGLTACEFGPLGFLPEEPHKRSEVLADHNLSAVGGFVPVLLHHPDHDPEPEIRKELEAFQAAGAGVIVLAASTGVEGYDERPVLSELEWQTLLDNLARLKKVSAEYGITAVLHPHVGTVVEGPEEINRVLNGSDMGFCFDTGHMMIGGTDPVEFAKKHASRVGHVHLKDVNKNIAQQVLEKNKTYYEGVKEGLYTPLGQGDVDIAAIVTALEQAGYPGWYVLEQDTVVTEEPKPHDGPVKDVEASREFLLGVLSKQN